MLTTPLWKFATILAGLVSLSLIVGLIVSQVRNRELTDQRAALSAQINDPKTGYIVRLAQATTNVETLKIQLETQHRSFQVKADERNRALIASEARLRIAQADTRAMQLKLNRFLATKPQGVTLEDRVRDIDSRAMTELVE